VIVIKFPRNQPFLKQIQNKKGFGLFRRGVLNGRCAGSPKPEIEKQENAAAFTNGGGSFSEAAGAARPGQMNGR